MSLILFIDSTLSSLPEILHFPAFLAMNGDHVTQFWPVR